MSWTRAPRFTTRQAAFIDAASEVQIVDLIGMGNRHDAVRLHLLVAVPRKLQVTDAAMLLLGIDVTGRHGSRHFDGG